MVAAPFYVAPTLRSRLPLQVYARACDEVVTNSRKALLKQVTDKKRAQEARKESLQLTLTLKPDGKVGLTQAVDPGFTPDEHAVRLRRDSALRDPTLRRGRRQQGSDRERKERRSLAFWFRQLLERGLYCAWSE